MNCAIELWHWTVMYLRLYQWSMKSQHTGYAWHIAKMKFVTINSIVMLAQRACHGVVPHIGAIFLSLHSYSGCWIHRLSMNTGKLIVLTWSLFGNSKRKSSRISMKHTVHLSYKGAYGLAVLPGNSFIKLTLAGCQRNQTVQISYGPHAAHSYRVSVENIRNNVHQKIKHIWKIPIWLTSVGLAHPHPN